LAFLFNKKEPPAIKMKGRLLLYEMVGLPEDMDRIYGH